ncbi:MAG: 1-deoxy-D-xylulose-5-phosphate reductoisomerase [Myxococcales bacterium]|nr:1-deoxy-D-xylulose-5-phosphate reductoisomerase [Myxococcales bacterium]
MKRISILGSTGSVGTQTLAVVAQNPEKFCVEALAAGKNVELLADQIKQFAPKLVSMADPQSAAELAKRVGEGVEIMVGDAGLEAVASVAPCDLVVAALVGAVGLRPTLAAIRAGRDVALANKEVMVMAGALMLREVKARGVTLLPVDSEHSAIFQALSGQRSEDVSRIILTCSGGPFRGWDAERISRATIEQALNHPKWDMGRKISIDSASLMNKGLEVIEARWLFDVPPECIDVVVHPQSIVHSLVEFRDTSVIAQLGLPDMRVPIAVALAHPERLALEIPRLDLAQVARFDFEPPNRENFPCLDLAYRALAGSEAAPAVLNAANEASVAAFLDGSIAFGEIAAINKRVLDEHLHERAGTRVGDIDEIVAADAWARERAQIAIEQFAPDQHAEGAA